MQVHQSPHYNKDLVHFTIIVICSTIFWVSFGISEVISPYNYLYPAFVVIIINIVCLYIFLLCNSYSDIQYKSTLARFLSNINDRKNKLIKFK